MGVLPNARRGFRHARLSVLSLSHSMVSGRRSTPPAAGPCGSLARCRWGKAWFCHGMLSMSTRLDVRLNSRSPKSAWKPGKGPLSLMFLAPAEDARLSCSISARRSSSISARRCSSISRRRDCSFSARRSSAIAVRSSNTRALSLALRTSGSASGWRVRTSVGFSRAPPICEIPPPWGGRLGFVTKLGRPQDFGEKRDLVLLKRIGAVGSPSLSPLDLEEFCKRLVVGVRGRAHHALVCQDSRASFPRRCAGGAWKLAAGGGGLRRSAVTRLEARKEAAERLVSTFRSRAH
mmetsp:Transcript_21361/g.50632  ORF Transcript_21361/g.50632 Transcript_21361/m.50632 type:complete len:291 (-) Transcript_21361:200-1072(-)